MKILAVIPSRYASTRFPGKPLADICGKSMVRRVYEQAMATGWDFVAVATDDRRIAEHVTAFGGRVIMTGTHHPNGTSRCLEVVDKLETEGKYFDVIINIQGDEPLVQPEHLHQVAALFENPETDIATLIHPITDITELFNPHAVKVITGKNKTALYFSRQTIPFVRNENRDNWLNKTAFFKHIGIYGYRTEVLKKIVQLPEGKLEAAEKLEQLRWLESGYVIKADVTDYKGIGIDTPEDLQKLINKICNNPSL